jgi:hypothetical protein
MERRSKKKVEYISLDECIRKAFYTGLSIGAELGNFGTRISPELVGKSPEEIAKVLEKGVAAIFKKYEV